jgi:hypothetical protein
MSTLCTRTRAAYPLGSTGITSASLFGSVHLARIWDTEVIGSVASAAAGGWLFRPQKETMNRQRVHFPVNASVTDRGGNEWHSATKAGSACRQL